MKKNIKFASKILLIIFLFLLACQNNKKQKVENSDVLNSAIQTTGYNTKTGKKFIVSIDHSGGASICDVKVDLKAFSNSNEQIQLGTIDPVIDVFLNDLDNNGFEEIYIVTQSAGSGSYSTIYGIASNYDKSATPIFVRPVSEKQKEKGELFEGFMGHNQFSIESGKLINSFPVYLEGDSNSNPSGGQRIIQYQLIAGEAGWILQTEKVLNSD